MIRLRESIKEIGNEECKYLATLEPIKYKGEKQERIIPKRILAKSPFYYEIKIKW